MNTKALFTIGNLHTGDISITSAGDSRNSSSFQYRAGDAATLDAFFGAEDETEGGAE